MSIDGEVHTIVGVMPVAYAFPQPTDVWLSGVQNVGEDGRTDFTFTVTRSDYDNAIEVLKPVVRDLGAGLITGANRIAKVSMVGVGMRSHAGVATQMFDALARESINIQMISTSEIKISVVIDEKYLELAVRAIHSAFGLSKEQVSEG